MSINCNVTPGQTYGARYTVDYADLNKLGTPSVAVPDGGTLGFELAKLAAGTAGAPALAFTADLDTGLYNPAPNVVGVAGQLGAADGTLAAPALAFASDLDTGFYAAAANRIGVAGALALADGTAAAPALTFATDPDTGLYRPNPDVLAVTIAGAPVATFTPTGIDAVGLTVGGSQVALSGPHPQYGTFWTDFLTGTDVEKSGFVYTYTGTASLAANGVQTVVGGYGFVTLTASTSTSAAALFPIANGVQFFAKGNYVCEWRAKTGNIISTPTNRYRMKVGFAYNATGGTLSFFSGFSYCDADAAQWQIVVNGATVATTSILVVAAQWARFRVVGTPTETCFYINGTLVYTHAGQIDGSTQPYGPAAAVAGLAGAGGGVVVDWAAITAEMNRA